MEASFKSTYRLRTRRRSTPMRHTNLPATTLLLSTLLLALSSSPTTAFLPQTLRNNHISNKRTTSRTRATRDKISNNTEQIENTWSRSSSSRFGVRKRVKAVLKKAKNRTGRSNFSDNNNNNNSAKNIVADAASIGGSATDLVFAPDARNNTSSLVPLSSLNGTPLEKVRSKVSVNSLLKGGASDVDPLPFVLPTLSNEQKELLAAGERIQEQSKMGREGSGYVVLDVQAPPYVVWECLLDFESYPEKIGTVRSMRMFTNTHLSSSYLAEKPILTGTGRETRHYGQASISRASFILSKFRLNIAAVHKYQPHPDGHFMVFTLDPACKNVVLKDAKGIWYTESNPDGLGDDVTRVWLLCELKVSPLLPTMIVDYAAKRAMPRATTWLKPAVEDKERELHQPQ